MLNLYQKKHKAFPETVEIDGKSYAVNMDFRNILRIFALIDDDFVPDEKKYGKITEWFYEDDIMPDTGLAGFAGMANPRHAERGECERQFCYDFDAEEIYAGFLSEYGIDLTDICFLHWHKFKILLANLPPESAFKRKIELRFMDPDLSGLSGAALAKLREAKQSVQLPEKNYNSEIRENNEFNEIWGKAGGN